MKRIFLAEQPRPSPLEGLFPPGGGVFDCEEWPLFSFFLHPSSFLAPPRPPSPPQIAMIRPLSSLLFPLMTTTFPQTLPGLSLRMQRPTALFFFPFSTACFRLPFLGRRANFFPSDSLDLSPRVGVGSPSTTPTERHALCTLLFFRAASSTLPPQIFFPPPLPRSFLLPLFPPAPPAQKGNLALQA